MSYVIKHTNPRGQVGYLLRKDTGDVMIFTSMGKAQAMADGYKTCGCEGWVARVIDNPFPKG